MLFHPARVARLIAVTGLLLAANGCADRTVPPGPTATQPCPQWSEFPAHQYSNRDSPYLGCTTGVNLRAMLENPADLERGRPLGPTDGETAARAVQTYHEGRTRLSQGAGGMLPSASTPVSTGSSSVGGP